MKSCDQRSMAKTVEFARRIRPSLIAFALITSSWVAHGGFAAEVTRIPAGTVVTDSGAKTWNRVVLLAKPRIVSGSVESLNESIRDAVSSFSLTMMARVNKKDGAFQLDDVGLGYSVPIKSHPTVIDSDSVERLGVSLGFIQRQVLGQHETRLATTRVIVRTSTLLIFDVPAIFFRDGKHRDFVARHLVWIDPASGRAAMATWLMVRRQDGRLVIASDPPRVVSAATKEDRRIHVDGDQFFLGIPGEHAFALEELPPGEDLNWTDALKRLATRSTYDADSLGKLSREINRLVRADAEPAAAR